jgi:hypothetical protein
MGSFISALWCPFNDKANSFKPNVSTHAWRCYPAMKPPRADNTIVRNSATRIKKNEKQRK